jgi:hypothetical protein
MQNPNFLDRVERVPGSHRNGKNPLFTTSASQTHRSHFHFFYTLLLLLLQLWLNTHRKFQVQKVCLRPSQTPSFQPQNHDRARVSCAKDLISRRILHNFFPRLSFICHHDDSQEIAIKEARKASKEEKNHKQEENNRTQHKDHSSLRMDLRKIEKNDLERSDANKISYRCRQPHVPTRPPFHPTAACQRQISRVIMHPTPVHFPPTTTTIERVENFFQMSDDWFYLSSELHCA